MAAPSWSTIAWRAFSLCYGLLCFCCFGAIAVWEGYVVKRPSPDFRRAVERERSRVWDLSGEVEPGLRHGFQRLEECGLTLHFITNNSHLSDGRRDARRKNLVIFLHGWPDNSLLWSKTMQLLRAHDADTTLVAVDLPGHGASESLQTYGATEMMEVLFEFIHGMRRKCLATANGKVVLVAHDWGALCAFKLAASTGAAGLVNRFVLCNAPLSQHAAANIQARLSSATAMLRSWLDHPLNHRPLLNAARTLTPLTRQLLRSSYVFIFNLPLPIAALAGVGCNLWSLRYINSLAVSGSRVADQASLATRLAATLGPSEAVLGTNTQQGVGYTAQSVRRRTAQGAFTESIKLYRQGLATQAWVKSPRTLTALSSLKKAQTRGDEAPQAGSESPRGALKAPATIVWGEKDPALDSRILLEGLEAYLVEGSRVIRVPELGHWVPVEGRGPRVLAGVVWEELGVGPGRAIGKS